MKATLFLVTGCMMTACATPRFSPPTMGASFIETLSVPDGAEVETIYAVTVNAEGLRIRVPSNGCTTKADFKALVFKGPPADAPQPANATIYRLKPDRCRSFAAGSAWIVFSYADLGLEDARLVILGNPMTPWIGPGD